jgi:hypothetical protein
VSNAVGKHLLGPRSDPDAADDQAAIEQRVGPGDQPPENGTPAH